RERLPGGGRGAGRATQDRSCGRAAPARADGARARGAERRGGRGGACRSPRDGARRGKPPAADARGAARALHGRRDLRDAARGVGDVRLATRSRLAVSYDPTIYLGSAVHYRSGRPAYSPQLEDVLVAELGLDGSGRLLDAGCGPGILTLRLAH